MYSHLNGEISHNPLLLDRGLHYGDGLFETITLYQPIADIQRHPLWSYHLKRLQAGCAKLFFPDQKDEFFIEKINHFLEAMAPLEGPSPWILKLIYTRGQGQRGYLIPDHQQPNLILLRSEYPSVVRPYQQNGISAEFSPVTLYPEPYTAGIKHLNRLTQILAGHFLSKHCQEALLLNPDQYVVEGSKTNLFMMRQDTLYTPCLQQHGIEGVARAWLLDYCQKTNHPVQIQPIHKSELLDAEQLFVCNSVIGIWPIAKLDNKQFSVGPTVTQLQRAWGKHIANYAE